VSDGLPGMEEAILRVYPNAEWQQCLLHKMRNTLAKVRKEDRGTVAWELRRIYLADSRKEAESAWHRFRVRWERKYPEAVRAWEEELDSLFVFFRYPKALWTYLRSTNLLERFIRELRRGTKVRDHKFPKPEAIYKLFYLECERHGIKWERRLKGFAEAQEELNRSFEGRYPTPHNVTQNS